MFSFGDIVLQTITFAGFGFRPIEGLARGWEPSGCYGSDFSWSGCGMLGEVYRVLSGAAHALSLRMRCIELWRRWLCVLNAGDGRTGSAHEASNFVLCPCDHLLDRLVLLQPCHHLIVDAAIVNLHRDVRWRFRRC